MDNFLTNYLETIIFIVFLIIILALSMYFKIYDIIGIQNTITLFAVVVALGTGILTSFYNKNVLKQAKELNEKTLDHAKKLNEKTLLQSEKNLRIQLLFEESRKSLYHLKKLLESDFNIRLLKQFMESSEAIYLPTNTKNFINKSIKEINDLERDAPWNPPEPTDEQWEIINREHYAAERDMIDSLDDVGRFEYEYHEKVLEVKSQIKTNVMKNLNKDPIETE